MSDIENARQVFEKAGLAFPTIPEKLAEQLKEQSKWVFSTRPIDVWPYFLHSYVEEAEKSEVDDYAVLCHAGHGVNSWAIHYYLVQDSLRMFLQLGWGGIYSDEGEDAARIRDCFLLADQIASVAKTVGRFQAGNYLTVVVSNFWGSYWLPPGKSRHENDKRCDDPLAVLKEALAWLRRYKPDGVLTTKRRSAMSVTLKAKKALHDKFSGKIDEKGYFHSAKENLLPNIDWEPIEQELRDGDGDELRMKFAAIHSSAALAVNCFGPFKKNPNSLTLLGKRGAKAVMFEEKFPIFDKKVGAPNIDVWIDFGDEAVAVESKFLEILVPKKPVFSRAYEKLAPPTCDPIWWSAYERAMTGEKQFLNQAQLIKHYFGLNKRAGKNPGGPRVTLLYIFWEPQDWKDWPEYNLHREQVKAFADLLPDAQIPFAWMSYNDLWEEWSAVPQLAEHVKNLKDRYQVRLRT